MSHDQKMLRLRIDNTTDIETRNALKQEPSAAYHPTKNTGQRSVKLDQLADEVEQLHDGANTFKSVRLLYRKPHKQPTIHDDQGRTVVDTVEFFGDQF